VPLTAVFDLAAELTARYGKAGYVLSRVIVPPQELNETGATITLRALEGYVDRVMWPEGLESYRDFFTDYAARITAERPIRAQTMERYLLLANDLPGLTFKSSLTPSQTNPLASTMIVSLEEKFWDLYLGVDNRGTDGSGPVQPTVIGTLNNALGLHETVKLGYTTAGPEQGRAKPELHYVVFGYRQVLDSEGLTFDFSGNASWGDPGSKTLKAIDYETEGFNWSAALIYPFIRTRPENLTGTIAFDWKDSEGWLLGGTFSLDRLRIIRAELQYDRADELGGINQLVVSASHGIEGLGSTRNSNPLASRANGKVDFLKATAYASRTQPLPANFQAFAAVSGQWTDDPLLSSQECGYGGATFGRAYEPSVITGDTCIQLLGELRYNVAVGATALRQVFDYMQLYGFADYGHIWNLEAPLGTARKDDAASAGGGIRFGKAWLSTDFQLSRTVERPASVAVDDGWEGFFHVSARF
jgi:hemolysin activation/secretion protein